MIGGSGRRSSIISSYRSIHTSFSSFTPFPENPVMRTNSGTRRDLIHAVALALAAALAAPGCGTIKTSGTSRTATEQLLLSNAWDSALGKVDFRALAGVPIYLDTANITAVDQGWVVSSIRQSLLDQGVLLRQKADQAQWVVEARVGVYGTDASNWLLGIAQTTVPQTITGVPAGTIPEMPLIKKSDQKGVAKLALFAYDRSSGRMVWESGTMMAVATAKDVTVFGVGPIQSGTIRNGASVADMPIPLSNGMPPPPANLGRFNFRKQAPTPAAQAAPAGTELKQPANMPDLEGFAP